MKVEKVRNHVNITLENEIEFRLEEHEGKVIITKVGSSINNNALLITCKVSNQIAIE